MFVDDAIGGRVSSFDRSINVGWCERINGGRIGGLGKGMRCPSLNALFRSVFPMVIPGGGPT